MDQFRQCALPYKKNLINSKKKSTMKNLKFVCAIIICVLHTAIKAQDKTDQQVSFATFEIYDARENGNDITPDIIEQKAKLVLYKSNDSTEIMFSNFWEKADSQSFGRIYAITKEENAATDKLYGNVLYNFQWSYINTYDDKEGTAKIRLLIVYKPEGVYFQCTIIPENLKELVYKGRMEGSLEKLQSTSKN
jgi:hypothetical protein